MRIPSSAFGAALLAAALFAPPAAAQQAPAPAPATARAPGTARMHVHAYAHLKGPVRLYAMDGKQTFVCEAPCTADVFPGTPLRVTYGDDDSARDFVFDAKAGHDVDFEVRPASKGALAGGIVLVSIGGLLDLIGLVLLAIRVGESGSDTDLTVGGAIVGGIGLGLTAGGIALIAGRSHEPRFKQNESRATVFRSDVAVANGGRGTAPVHAASAPLAWGFSF